MHEYIPGQLSTSECSPGYIRFKITKLLGKLV